MKSMIETLTWYSEKIDILWHLIKTETNEYFQSQLVKELQLLNVADYWILWKCTHLRHQGRLGYNTDMQTRLIISLGNKYITTWCMKQTKRLAMLNDSKIWKQITTILLKFWRTFQGLSQIMTYLHTTVYYVSCLEYC